VETPLGDAAHQRHRTTLEGRMDRPAGPRRLSLVASAGRLPLTRPWPSAQALPLFVPHDPAVDVVQSHDSDTPRSRSTSSCVLNWDRASKVALTNRIGLLVPKLLVRILRIPTAS